MEEEYKLKIRKQVFENIIIGVAIVTYFMLIIFSSLKINETILINEIKVLAFSVAILSIMVFEIAYHKDSGKIAINGIEVLVLGIFTLTMFVIINKYKITYQKYLTYAIISIIVYYVLKAIIICTKEKRKYLNNLSDIHEILENNPVKKEAKKRENS